MFEFIDAKLSQGKTMKVGFHDLWLSRGKKWKYKIAITLKQ